MDWSRSAPRVTIHTSDPSYPTTPRQQVEPVVLEAGFGSFWLSENQVKTCGAAVCASP